MSVDSDESEQHRLKCCVKLRKRLKPWLPPYRFFIFCLAFMSDMCITLLCRNIVFAMNAMVRRKHHTDQSMDAHGKCFDPSKAHNETDANTSHKVEFSQDFQANLLVVTYVGLLFGNFAGLKIYDYVFMRPVCAMSLIMAGILNILTYQIVMSVGQMGLLITRFYIGLYMGLVIHAATCKWPNHINYSMYRSFSFLL